MPSVNTPASKDQPKSDPEHPNFDSFSQPKAGESLEPAQLARSSSRRSRSAEAHFSVAKALSYGMERWLAQGSRDEPWYTGARK